MCVGMQDKCGNTNMCQCMLGINNICILQCMQKCMCMHKLALLNSPFLHLSGGLVGRRAATPAASFLAAAAAAAARACLGPLHPLGCQYLLLASVGPRSPLQQVSVAQASCATKLCLATNLREGGRLHRGYVVV